MTRLNRPQALKIEYWRLPGGTRLGLRAAVVADLHNRNHDRVLAAVRSVRPDLILIPGDFMSALDGENGPYAPDERHTNLAGFELLRRFCETAPVYYSVGNHEFAVNDENRRRIRAAGAVLLEDAYVRADGFWIGGVNSAIIPGDHLHTPAPNVRFLRTFAREKGYKLLLSHHPEIYDRYIRPLGFDAVVSGHAHGGQWRVGGHGIFAPGQGLFPRYTRGIYDRRLVVSPGLSNHTFVPRLFNPPTLVVLGL